MIIRKIEFWENPTIYVNSMGQAHTDLTRIEENVPQIETFYVDPKGNASHTLRDVAC